MINKKKILNWAGSSLAIIGVAFVVLRLRDHWSSVDLSRISMSAWITLAILALVYGLASSFLFSTAWWNILASFKISVTRRWAFHVYGVSQLAKYVPGNIFHLAGRQVLGMSAGVASGKLLKSIIWELGLAAVAGATYGWLILPGLFPNFSSSLSVILSGLSMMAAIIFLKKLFDSHVAKTFFCMLFLQLITGVIFALLLYVITENTLFSLKVWVLISGSYIIAWLIGLVTPGAPAGAGVRELVLLLLLKGIVQEADLLVAVVLGRILTVLGDVIFFVMAFFMPAKSYQLPEKTYA